MTTKKKGRKNGKRKRQAKTANKITKTNKFKTSAKKAKLIKYFIKKRQNPGIGKKRQTKKRQTFQDVKKNSTKKTATCEI